MNPWNRRPRWSDALRYDHPLAFRRHRRRQPCPIAVSTQLLTSTRSTSTDLRKGDRFNVVPEAIYEEGNPVRARLYLAADSSATAAATVVLYRGQAAREQYLQRRRRGSLPAGAALALEFSRVSSNFSRRLHPDPRQLARPQRHRLLGTCQHPVIATSGRTVVHQLSVASAA